jgi:phosphatidylserine/phosphatidylglycerophosphate/cardiolipin synthase-like enzyme
MRSHITRTLVATLAGLPLIVAITGAKAPRSTALPAVDTGTVFNNPEGSRSRQYAIINHIVGNIEASATYAKTTGAHPTIRVVIYSIGAPTFADALADAHRAGVNVQIIMDHHAINDMWTRLAANLNRNLWKGDTSFAKTCGAAGSCLNGTTGSATHAKYFTFSLGGRRVVTVTSSNPTKVQAEITWNHAYTVADDAKLYNSYVSYFNALRDGPERRQPNYYRYTSTEPKAYYFPKGKGSDTVEDFLDNVSACRGTTVRVAMFGWTKGRRNLATKLVSMGRAGCKVDILMTDGAVDGSVKSTLANKRNVTVTDTSKGDGCSGPYACHYTHSKYLLISGRYLGSTRRLVFAGSPNWTVNGLRRNDEVLQRIDNAGVYAAFVGNFNEQKAAVSARSSALRRAETPEKELPIRPSELKDS